MDEGEIEVISSSQYVNKVAAVLQCFLKHNGNQFSFPSLNAYNNRAILWTALFQHLQNKKSVEIHSVCLAVIRVLSRDKTDLESLLCEKWITTLIERAGLYNYDGTDDNAAEATALPNKDVMVEALKCLCNLTYNSEAARAHCANTSISQGLVARLKVYKELSYKDDIMLFDMKLMFILTALRQDIKLKIKNELHGMEYLTNCLSEIILESSKSNDKNECGPFKLTDQKQAIMCDILKAQFNLIIQTSSEDPENKEDEVMFLKLMPVITSILCAETTTTDKSMELKSNVANLLTGVPPKFYSYLTPELEKGESSKYTYNGSKMDAIHFLLDFLQHRLTITSGTHNQYENLSPILTVLNKSSRGCRMHRKYLRQEVLPPLRDVSKPPEKGNTLRNQLCRLLTTPVTSVRDLVAEFLFILCKEKVGRMVKYTGFGNAAGHLAQKGLMGGGVGGDGGRGVDGGGVDVGVGGDPYSSSSDDSDTEEYLQAAPHIDPVVGCTRPPRTNPFEGMSDEQKEYEAMKLVKLFDKLVSDGVMKPARVGPDGRPQAVEHVLELREPPNRTNS